jgi:hypothetical protein
MIVRSVQEANMSTKSIALLASSCVLGTLLITFVGVAVLHQRSEQRFGVVDLTSIVQKQQERGVRLLADPDGDVTAKKNAMTAATDFGKRINEEVLALSKECGCVLLMREAIVAGQVDDLTPRLMARLNGQ